MARWALRAPHYLNVPDNEWEQQQTDRGTGRTVRLRFKVPRLFDPDDPNDHTPPKSGEVIVCYEGKGQRHDHVFFGEPTPDMDPLDEEAEKISEALRPKWIHPMSEQALPATGAYSEALLSKFEGALNDIVNRLGIPKAENTSLKGADAELLAKLQAQMEAQAIRIAELEAKQAGETLGPEPGEAIENLTLEELETAPPPPTVPAANPVRRV